MNTAQITKAARVVLRLIDDYTNDPKKQREIIQDPLILGFFEARFGGMSRQHKIYIGNGSYPKRVDFRHGGTNPVLIEVAVRPPDGWAQLYGHANRGELNKLTRFPHSKAKLRLLLLLDLYHKPILRSKLKASYDKVKSSRGKYKRHSVRVVYVHSADWYHFIWQPL